MNALLLLLGGSGERFGGDKPKQFTEIDFEGVKRPLFDITARKLLSALPIDISIFVTPQADILSSAIAGLLADFPGQKIQLAEPGATRHGSLRSGLKALEQFSGIERLMVHDANRPYLSGEFLDRVNKQWHELSVAAPAFIPVAPVVDSVVRVNGKNITGYENRRQLKRVQTPQLMHYPTFQNKFATAQLPSDFTDEGSLCLALGMPVGFFEGDVANVKITFAADLLQS